MQASRRANISLYLSVIVSVLLSCWVTRVKGPGIFFQNGSNETKTSPLDCGGQLNGYCRCLTFNIAYESWQTIFKSFCSTWETISNCLEKNTLPGHYDYLMVDKPSFTRRATYVCSLYNDVEADLDCLSSDRTSIQECDKALTETLNAYTEPLSIEVGCQLAINNTKCYQEGYLSDDVSPCPKLVSHFFRSFMEIFISTKCTAYEKLARTDQCANMERMYGDSLEECYTAASVVGECLERERPYSLHPEDRLQHIDFNYQRYEDYKREICRVFGEMDKTCTSFTGGQKYRSCMGPFVTAFVGLIERHKHDTVTVSEICPLYDNLMDCTTDAFRQCHKGPLYYNLSACAAAPQSCPCPIQLEVRSSSQTARQNHRNIIVLLLISIQTQFYL